MSADATGDQAVATAKIEVAVDRLLANDFVVGKARRDSKTSVNILIQDRFEFVETAVDSRGSLPLG